MASEIRDGDMDARVGRLELIAQESRERLARIETRMDGLAAREDVLAVREDVLRLEAQMHKELHGLTWKLIGVFGALVAAAYFIARTVH